MMSEPEVNVAPVPVAGTTEVFTPDRPLPRHRHAKGQLLYATTGVMQVDTDAGEWVLPRQRALWIPPELSHGFSCRRETHVYALYVEPGFIDLPTTECRIVDVSRLLHELVLRAVDLPRMYQPGDAAHRLASVVADELIGLRAEPLHLPLPEDPRARRLCDWLRSQPDDPSTLAELAPAFGAGERTMARIIRRETGLAFGAWRERLRAQRGVELLAEGQRVTSVAMTLGYQTTSAFIAAFKRVFGVTPGDYFARR